MPDLHLRDLHFVDSKVEGGDAIFDFGPDSRTPAIRLALADAQADISLIRHHVVPKYTKAHHIDLRYFAEHVIVLRGLDVMIPPEVVAAAARSRDEERARMVLEAALAVLAPTDTTTTCGTPEELESILRAFSVLSRSYVGVTLPPDRLDYQRSLKRSVAGAQPQHLRTPLRHVLAWFEPAGSIAQFEFYTKRVTRVGKSLTVHEREPTAHDELTASHVVQAFYERAAARLNLRSHHVRAALSRISGAAQG